jgi:hypothetical protein
VMVILNITIHTNFFTVLPVLGIDLVSVHVPYVVYSFLPVLQVHKCACTYSQYLTFIYVQITTDTLHFTVLLLSYTDFAKYGK